MDKYEFLRDFLEQRFIEGRAVSDLYAEYVWLASQHGWVDVSRNTFIAEVRRIYGLKTAMVTPEPRPRETFVEAGE